MRTGHGEAATADQPRRTVPLLGPELRRLRETRGLTQAQTARTVGLSARSAVADYESGRRIPPEDILAGYEKAFALVPGALRRLREQIHAYQAEQHYAAAVAVTPPDTGPAPPREHAATPAPATAAAAAPAAAPTPSGAPRRAHRVLLASAALITLCSALAGSATAIGSASMAVNPAPASTGPPPDSEQAQPGPSPEPMDDADPLARGCYLDAVIVQQVPLRLSDGRPFGTLRLSHSPRCEASWGSAYYGNPAQYTIRITVHRPADNAAIGDESNVNTPPGNYSHMLSTTAGCVWVEAVVTTPDGISTPGHTACIR
jgi:transcriptional regulator with XRE-family HTH domain